LTVFDNVVARAVEFRRALLDNLRMGEVQRRRGDLLEEEITGRIRQVKRAQQYMLDLLGCLPIGVAVLNAVGRVDLINNRAEEALEPVLSAGPGALRALLDQIPVQGGQRRGEVEVGQRRLELHRSDLTVAEEDKQQVLVVREPEGAGPSMGTLVEDTLLHLRTGLGWLVARSRAALRICAPWKAKSVRWGRSSTFNCRRKNDRWSRRRSIRRWSRRGKSRARPRCLSRRRRPRRSARPTGASLITSPCRRERGASRPSRCRSRAGA
jgi:hypothetical protein